MKIFSLIEKINYEQLPKIKIYFKELYFIKHFRLYFFLLLSINFFLWLIAYRLRRDVGTDQMALHYNINSGFDYYGRASEIYIIPLIGLVMIMANVFIFAGIKNTKYAKFFLHILLPAAFLVNLTLIAGIFVLKLVNIG